MLLQSVQTNGCPRAVHCSPHVIVGETSSKLKVIKRVNIREFCLSPPVFPAHFDRRTIDFNPWENWIGRSVSGHPRSVILQHQVNGKSRVSRLLRVSGI
ncbi:hypothetical protein J6590_079466 [Homalodisca vitripennis]|nr:hypothetical protein J6590_079466 [Homalodisca vitripennis]